MESTRRFFMFYRSGYSRIARSDNLQKYVNETCPKVPFYSIAGLMYTSVSVMASSVDEAWDIFLDWFYDKRFDEEPLSSKVWDKFTVASSVRNMSFYIHIVNGKLFSKVKEITVLKQLPKKYLLESFCFFDEEKVTGLEYFKEITTTNWKELIYVSEEWDYNYFSLDTSATTFSTMDTVVKEVTKTVKKKQLAFSKQAAVNFQNQLTSKFKNYNATIKWNNRKFR